MSFSLREWFLPLRWRRAPRRPTDTALEQDLDEDLVEFMNLREADTGVSGTIHVRTRITRHGPSIKYYAGRAGGDQPSCSIAIADPAQVVASNLLDRDIPRSVFAWVVLNREALQKFWDEGNTWYADEVERFRHDLRRVEAST